MDEKMHDYAHDDLAAPEEKKHQSEEESHEVEHAGHAHHDAEQMRGEHARHEMSGAEHSGHDHHAVETAHGEHAGHNMGGTEHTGHDHHTAETEHGEHAGHTAGGGEGHQAHTDHTGHEQIFRRKFWVSLIISIPAILYSMGFQMMTGLTMPAFAGSEWIAPVLSVFIFVYGACHFCRWQFPS